MILNIFQPLIAFVTYSWSSKAIFILAIFFGLTSGYFYWDSQRHLPITVHSDKLPYKLSNRRTTIPPFTVSHTGDYLFGIVLTPYYYKIFEKQGEKDFFNFTVLQRKLDSKKIVLKKDYEILGWIDEEPVLMGFIELSSEQSYHLEVVIQDKRYKDKSTFGKFFVKPTPLFSKSVYVGKAISLLLAMFAFWGSMFCFLCMVLTVLLSKMYLKYKRKKRMMTG